METVIGLEIPNVKQLPHTFKGWLTLEKARGVPEKKSTPS